MSDTISVKLKRGSVNVLCSLLQGTDWYTDTRTAYLAGSVLVDVLAGPLEAPKNDKGELIQGQELKDWLTCQMDYVFTKGQVEACISCVRFFLKSKKLSVNSYVYELMKVLNVCPEAVE